MSGGGASLGWLGIFRLGLVQTALGAVVVLTTSTLNRVMVVELALPAMLPGALVAIHYAVQITRPRMGYGSDRGGRRTPWIVGGMACLALGGVAAAVATAWLASSTIGGLALAVLAFVMIGAGVGAAGTSLLVLLALQVEPRRRAAAATIVWVMMIAGFVITATAAGHFLEPFSYSRMIVVVTTVACAAFLLATLAVRNIEPATRPAAPAALPRAAGAQAEPASFRAALGQVWGEPRARNFAVFVFVSMLAYSAQDLILEPFAGLVFGLTPGQSTKLAGVQHAGVFAGMILVALAGSAIGGQRLGSMRLWTVGGCIASAVALAALSLGGQVGPDWPLRANVFALGLANGAFAVAAIGSMMELVARGRERREGTRMGMWGAAQAIAFGLGGFLGAASADLARLVLEAPAAAYGTVFAGEAVLFLLAARLAARIEHAPAASPAPAEPGCAAAAAQVTAR